LRSNSIGLALTDTLDDLIEGERINPQLAMKILGTFDQAITEALQKNVKNRLQFKVNTRPHLFPPRQPSINLLNVTFPNL
jgi:transcription initiation factor TFIIA small subunit